MNSRSVPGVAVAVKLSRSRSHPARRPLVGTMTRRSLSLSLNRRSLLHYREPVAVLDAFAFGVGEVQQRQERLHRLEHAVPPGGSPGLPRALCGPQGYLPVL